MRENLTVPIYDAALCKKPRAPRGAGGVAPVARWAIGDSLRTDMTGAQALGIDGLFVSGGIHAQELGQGKSLPHEVLRGHVRRGGRNPTIWSCAAPSHGDELGPR